MAKEPWKILFLETMRILEASHISREHWTLGGGTVLTHIFEHRTSKDSDVFFTDRQFISYMSPRVNPVLDDSIYYREDSNFIKLGLPDGHIDFIFSPRASSYLPVLQVIEGHEIYVDHPVEIVSKKVVFRNEHFQARDAFDLAMVYTALGDELVNAIDISVEKLEFLEKRLSSPAFANLWKKRFDRIVPLPASKIIAGQELNLCHEFVGKLRQNLTSRPKL